MNRLTSGARALFYSQVSIRLLNMGSRLRLSSLTPLSLGALMALGACMLPPATSSALQAKEISMQDNKGQYQPYTPGMKLPKGVFPPMQGYTHEDLIEAAAKPAEALLKAEGVDRL